MSSKKTSIKKTVDKKVADTKKTVAKKPVVKKATAEKTIAKKSIAKKATSETTIAKKSVAKKTPIKKATSETTIAKKSVAKKMPVKKATSETTIAKKSTAKKAAVKKATSKKNVVDMINTRAIHYVPQDVDIVRELPDRYNETKLMLMVRDPEWSYFYWDVSDYDYSSNELDKRALHVKIFRLSGINISKHEEYIDVEVASSYGSWYIMLGIPHCYFIAELGYYDDKGHFIVLARSSIVYTPRNTISELYDEEWMCDGVLTKLLFESYDISNTLSSESLFNMINVYTLGGLSSSAASSSDLVKK